MHLETDHLRPLRPFQKIALETLRKPGHLICIAPTGAGKSLIYERAASRPGRRTLLISPLIALARQQRERLLASGLPVAMAVGQSREAPPEGKTGIWIVSPESLRNPALRSRLARWCPDFLVVDECHCLWEWGDDFRPAFREIPSLLENPELRSSLWLTATLPTAARSELLARLPPPATVMGGFELPAHLNFEVRQAPWSERIDQLLGWLSAQSGNGVIFVGTRGSTHRLEGLLRTVGRNPVCYHAGLSHEERRNAERQVGERVADVVIATSAFGMGMDHPHLTWAVLLQPPGSLLAMAQALGRAGRDSTRAARVLVLWDDDDFRLLEWNVRGNARRRSELLETRRFLKSAGCRRAALSRYFDVGAAPAHCGNCDFCQ